jgi:hypothetical protein
VHLSISPIVGTEDLRAIMEVVHLWRLQLWRSDCIDFVTAKILP